MLERAAPYQCQGSQSWRPSKKILQSRRGLSQAFWRHGAGDLDLPTWCYAQVRALFETETGRNHAVRKPAGWSTPRSFLEEGPLLDFLYPPKTRAVINQLSSWTTNRWSRRGGTPDSTGAVRQFTQVAKSGRRPTSSTPSIDLWTEDLAEKRGSKLHESMNPQQALEILNQHIQTFNDGRYEALRSETWQLYLLIPKDLKSPALIHGLMNIFSESTRTVDARRMIRLFDNLQKDDYTLSSANKVVLALIEEDSIGKAVRVHDNILERFFIPDNFIATDLLLMHTLGHHERQLLFHVWTSRLRYSEEMSTSAKYEYWQRNFFKKARRMPGFVPNVLDLLRWLRTTPTMLKNADPGIGKLITGLASTLFSEGFSVGFFLGTSTMIEVLKILRNIGHSKPQIYENACLLSLEQGFDTDREKMDRAMAIYESFKVDLTFFPRQSLLQRLLSAAVQVNDESLVSMLLTDWRQYHGPLPQWIAGLSMKFYSHRGNVELVDILLKEYLNSNQERNVRLFHPLLHAHALLADPVSVEERMEWMQQNFGFDPDSICLNILLNAYGKADDVDGALNTLTLFFKSGLKPDDYTFGTIMAILADRGDVETVNQMLKVASSLQIPKSSVMMGNLVMAYLNNGDPKTAEDLAEKDHARLVEINCVRLVEKNHEKNHARLGDGIAESSTRMWTQVLAYHTMRRNFPEAMRVSQRMQSLKVRFDGMTYAAIMRVFVATKRTSMARTILDRIRDRQTNRLEAIHYAIVIDGFAGEYRFEDAFRVHADMLATGVAPTLSTQLALIRVHTLAAKHKFTYDTVHHPGIRLDISEETLEEFINGFDASLRTEKGPQLRSTIAPGTTAPHVAYFELLLASYGSRRAYDVVKMLLSRAETFATKINANLRTVPLASMKLLESVMRVHYRQNAHEDMEEAWNLAKATAMKLSKTPKNGTAVPAVHRYMLARVLDVYMRSLAARKDLDKMEGVIEQVLKLGFGLDNGNWNQYIQLLATAGYHTKAFLTCERNIMTNFPGWFTEEKKSRKWAASAAKGPGLEFLGGRLTFLAPGQYQATYKTMIRLGKSLKTLRSQAPYDYKYAEQLKTLVSGAPRTCAAVNALPTRNHPAITHVLGDRAEVGEKRRLPEVQFYNS